MTILKVKDLTIREVHQLLKIQEQVTNNSFTTFLPLEPLTEFEHEELRQIRHDFREYISTEKVSEGLVKALTTFPLLRLAGFYRSPIKISLEENIAEINIEDEDKIISGRLDILCVNKEQPKNTDMAFWLLVIETKNSGVTTYMGLPQLLTYAYESLTHQTTVWGLVTNGIHYQFVYLQQGDTLSYQLMPELNLMNPDASIQLLQVFKAICKLQND